MTSSQPCRFMAWAVLVPLLLGGCSILREFGPAVEIRTLTAGDAIEAKRGDILTRGKLSDATNQTIRVAALDAQACAKPISTDCVQALVAVPAVVGLGNGSAVEHDNGGEAQRFVAGEVGHSEVFQRDAVLLSDVFHGKS